MSLAEIAWPADGLLPVVVQDARTGTVLTLAYANREALALTLERRETVLFSRSRKALWTKGETSGNTQRVISVAHDCDADALLYRVIPAGPACQTGAASCFEGGQLLDASDADAGEGTPDGEFAQRPFVLALAHLESTFAVRAAAVRDGTADPASYVAKLLAGGVDRIAKKVGEEATEVVIAAKNADPAELGWETADLLFHTLLLLRERGVSLDDVGTELLRRAR